MNTEAQADELGLESPSHKYHRNYWFKIGLSQVEAMALKRVAQRLLKPKCQRSNDAAWWLLRAALAHYDLLEPVIFDDWNCEDALCGDVAGLHNASHVELMICNVHGLELPKPLKRTSFVQHFGRLLRPMKFN